MRRPGKPAVQASPALWVVTSPSIGFEMISFNLARGPKADMPFAHDVRIRQAFATEAGFAGPRGCPAMTTRHDAGSPRHLNF